MNTWEANIRKWYLIRGEQPQSAGHDRLNTSRGPVPCTRRGESIAGGRMPPPLPDPAARDLVHQLPGYGLKDEQVL